MDLAPDCAVRNDLRDIVFVAYFAVVIWQHSYEALSAFGHEYFGASRAIFVAEDA